MNGAIFPWRGGNHFELLIDGPAFFPRMLAAIEAAETAVDLEFYLVEQGACADALVHALCAAVRRGVQVRCLFDDFGTRAFAAVEAEALRAAGVQLRFYNPMRWGRGLSNLYRDHRKLLLIDARQAFVGGTGATDAFWTPGQPTSDWHEVMVALNGPLVSDWVQLFEHLWQVCPLPFAWREAYAQGLPRLPRNPPVGIGLGRVAYASARQHRDILQSLVRALRGAKKRIWLATPYFLPTWKVRRALRKAAERGVEVRLLLTGRHTDNPPVRFAGQRYYPRLLKAGVRIHEFQPSFLHLKMVLVDDWVSLGSCNFDHWNLRFNLDANLEALDPHLARAVAASFVEDFSRSREITLEVWRSRPLWRRVQQRLWGWLDRLVINLLDRRR
ncbi:MAG: phosphatidylserine/phosphatidylglycerophosphate/cardiolipin synthase family protein [Pseudomonas sp.]|uniref:phospholipase D-like domain-containing protein n=1 Tax=Pseudomonas sp. TaxID=306 RepID=UPI00339986CA